MALSIGAKASRSKTFTDEDVRGFAQISGDTNPVHLDDAYASRTRFGRRLVHGALTASLLSATLANDLPGEGTIYMSQSLQSKRRSHRRHDHRDGRSHRLSRRARDRYPGDDLRQPGRRHRGAGRGGGARAA